MSDRDRNNPKFTVRFPVGMRDRIATVSKANGRSMNAEIVARMDASLIGVSAVSDDFLDTPPEAPARRTVRTVEEKGGAER